MDRTANSVKEKKINAYNILISMVFNNCAVAMVSSCYVKRTGGRGVDGGSYAMTLIVLVTMVPSFPGIIQR